MDSEKEMPVTEQKRILIIDDDPDIIESLRMILTSSGFVVSHAMSAQEGLAALEDFTPDLVLCDMMMESMDAGMKAAETIRKKHADLPVFLLSSIGEATAASYDMQELGFSGVFQKPVNPDHLLFMLKKRLGS